MVKYENNLQKGGKKWYGDTLNSLAWWNLKKFTHLQLQDNVQHAEQIGPHADKLSVTNAQTTYALMSAQDPSLRNYVHIVSYAASANGMDKILCQMFKILFRH